MSRDGNPHVGGRSSDELNLAVHYSQNGKPPAA
eukprot:CAMPEP_0184385410 /NCGR_PEP_ID=MMETSP0007-20130409/8812_1 /TAXON_ID=97485 /ORGANISM="Prymnesium parvum, Strain Texoma1" /LENGTH=32 /DNA_ID= /DNA_START= /DNA_END= /DNA_ORIENTATION=